MEQGLAHHHTILGWINHHWMEISMVWFPAFLGYLNAFVASCKIMGWDRLATFCGKLEDALKAFVSNVKTQAITTNNAKLTK